VAERLFSLISEDRMSEQAKTSEEAGGLPRMSGVTMPCLVPVIYELRGLKKLPFLLLFRVQIVY
jgi:hypothetical protein